MSRPGCVFARSPGGRKGAAPERCLRLAFGQNWGGYFYAMEFVEGETLEALIKRSGRLEVGLAIKITSQVAAGLDAIYDYKLVRCYALSPGFELQQCR